MKKGTTFFLKFSRAIAALFMIPAFCFTAVSCSDDDDDPADPNLVGDMPASVTLAATEDNNTATIGFTAALAWKAAYATEDDKWFTFTPEAGTTAGKVTITVSAPQNPDAAKSGKIIITHGTQSYTVTVNQDAGGDDPARWNKTDLQGTVFAPDPYNTSESAVAEKTFTVTNIFDYATLEEAPFEIFTFYVDPETNQVKDSIVEWVNFEIAENSPAAKEGKKISVSVKPHEEYLIKEEPNVNPDQPNIISYEMLDRTACIVLAPKGTSTQEIFANGEVKEEYTSALIKQNAYKANIDITKASIFLIYQQLIPNMPLTKIMGNEETYIPVQETNFKQFSVVPDTQIDGNWFTFSVTKVDNVDNIFVKIDGNQIAQVFPTSQNYENSLSIQVYRGENLPAFTLNHIAKVSVKIGVTINS